MIISTICRRPICTLRVIARTLRSYNVKAVLYTERLCGDYGWELLSAWEDWLENQQDPHAAAQVADAAKKCAVEAQLQRACLEDRSTSALNVKLPNGLSTTMNSGYGAKDLNLIVELKSFEEAVREVEEEMREVAKDPGKSANIHRCAVSFASYANSLRTLCATANGEIDGFCIFLTHKRV